MTAADRLLRVDEVAEWLGLTVGTIYHLVSQRRIPCVRLSARCLRFSEAELTRWAEEKRVQDVVADLVTIGALT